MAYTNDIYTPIASSLNVPVQPRIAMTTPPFDYRQRHRPFAQRLPGDPMDAAGAVSPQLGGVNLGLLAEGGLSPIEMAIASGNPVDIFYPGSIGITVENDNFWIGGNGAIGVPGPPGDPGRDGRRGVFQRGAGGATGPHTLDSLQHTDVDAQANENLDLLWYNADGWDRLDNPTVAGETLVLSSSDTIMSWLDGAVLNILVLVAGTVTLTLGDNAGNTSFLVKDSDIATVFEVTSDGDVLMDGNIFCDSTVEAATDFTLGGVTMVGKSLGSANDTTLAYLEDKLVTVATSVGTTLGVTIVTNNDGANENLTGTIAVSELLTEITAFTNIEISHHEFWSVTAEGNASGRILDATDWRGRHLKYFVTWDSGGIPNIPYANYKEGGIYVPGNFTNNDITLFERDIGGGDTVKYYLDCSGNTGKLLADITDNTGAAVVDFWMIASDVDTGS